MRIVEVHSLLLRIPLGRTASISGAVFRDREYNLVRIKTDTGVEGVGYARGGVLVHESIKSALTPLLIGQSALANESLWQAMYDGTVMLGRRGAILRAISAVDIALWDIKAKSANLPLWQLLGGKSGQVPAYVSTAYYRDGQTPEDVASEVAACAGRGFRAVKMRVGGRPLKEDLARVKAARKALGDSIELRVDANYAYNDQVQGIRAARALEELGVGWLEEPTLPDNIRGSAAIADAVHMPIALGESECTRWGFQELIEKSAGDILQPDVTVVGGVTEWLKVAALASAVHLRIAPHYFWEVHAHLVAATPNAFSIEYFERTSDLVNFDDVLAEPFKVTDGVMMLPDRPGVGWVFDEKAIERFRTA